MVNKWMNIEYIYIRYKKNLKIGLKILLALITFYTMNADNDAIYSNFDFT